LPDGITRIRICSRAALNCEITLTENTGVYLPQNHISGGFKGRGAIGAQNLFLILNEHVLGNVLTQQIQNGGKVNISTNSTIEYFICAFVFK